VIKIERGGEGDQDGKRRERVIKIVQYMLIYCTITE